MIRISVHNLLKNTENIRHRSLTALEPNVSCLVFCLIFFVLRYMYLWRSELPFCNWSRVAKNLPVWYMLPFICRSNPSEKIRIIPYPQISCYTVHINYLQNDVLLNYFCAAKFILSFTQALRNRLLGKFILEHVYRWCYYWRNR